MMASGAPSATTVGGNDSDDYDEAIAELVAQLVQAKAKKAAAKAAQAGTGAAQAGTGATQAGTGAAQAGTAGRQGGAALAGLTARPAGEAGAPMHALPFTAPQLQDLERQGLQLAAFAAAAQRSISGAGGSAGGGMTAGTGGSTAQQQPLAPENGGGADEGANANQEPAQVYKQMLPAPAREPLIPVNTPSKDVATLAREPFCRYLGVQIRCERASKNRVKVVCSKQGRLGCEFGGVMTFCGEPVKEGYRSFCCDHNHPFMTGRIALADQEMIIPNCTTTPFDKNPDLLRRAYDLLIAGGRGITPKKIIELCLRDPVFATEHAAYAEKLKTNWKKQIENFVARARRKINEHTAAAGGGAKLAWLKKDLAPTDIIEAAQKEAAEVRWPGRGRASFLIFSDALSISCLRLFEWMSPSVF